MKQAKTLITASILAFTIASCSKNATTTLPQSTTSWEQVEKSFNMKNHFSDASKKAILAKYTTIDAFVAHVNERKIAIAKATKIVRNEPEILSANVTLPTGESYSFDMFSDRFVLDVLLEFGIESPTCDMSGSSSACVARLKDGAIDQSLQTFLDDDQLAAGYFLPCVTFPVTPIVFESGVEDALY
jgi:ferredoxin